MLTRQFKTDKKAETLIKLSKTKQIFGERVRQERIKLGFSQSELAIKINLYRAYLGNIERGIQNITADIMDQVSSYLNIPVHDLLNPKRLGNPEDFKMKSGRRKN